MGIPLGTAQSRLYYALASMRAVGDRAAGHDAGAGPGRDIRHDHRSTLRSRPPRPPRRSSRRAAVPDYRDDIVRQTARMRQRPAWTFPERWLPVSVITSRALAAPPVRWRVVGLVALLLLALAAGLVLVAGSQRHVPAPFGPAANGLVAYSKGGDIFTVDPATGARRAIVTGATTDEGPQYSLDGTRLAFLRTTGTSSVIVLADADGRNQVVVSMAPLIAGALSTWSPDGRSIAAVTDDNGDTGFALDRRHRCRHHPEGRRCRHRLRRGPVAPAGRTPADGHGASVGSGPVRSRLGGRRCRRSPGDTRRRRRGRAPAGRLVAGRTQVRLCRARRPGPCPRHAGLARRPRSSRVARQTALDTRGSRMTDDAS